MKEAIGSTLLFKLILIFISIYISIMAIGLNYAITFRHKNQIISLLEQFEGWDNAEEKINAYLGEVKYYGGQYSTQSIYLEQCLNKSHGYCVERMVTEHGEYYRVTTYMSFNMPVIGEFLSAPVTGETNIIFNLKDL